MPLCPRYITLCHPNSGVDNSAPPLQSRARVCVLPVKRNQAGAVAHRVPREKEPNRRSGTVGLPKASFNQLHLNQAGLWRCWSGVLEESFSQPNGPRWHCWSRRQNEKLSQPNGQEARLVEACCFLASLFCRKRAASECVHKVFPTKRARWHCWSGCVTSLDPNQAGRGGTVGQDPAGGPIVVAMGRPSPSSRMALLVGNSFLSGADQAEVDLSVGTLLLPRIFH